MSAQQYLLLSVVWSGFLSGSFSCLVLLVVSEKICLFRVPPLKSSSSQLLQVCWFSVLSNFRVQCSAVAGLQNQLRKLYVGSSPTTTFIKQVWGLLSAYSQPQALASPLHQSPLPMRRGCQHNKAFNPTRLRRAA